LYDKRGATKEQILAEDVSVDDWVLVRVRVSNSGSVAQPPLLLGRILNVVASKKQVEVAMWHTANGL
jgi:hypothetical protein